MLKMTVRPLAIRNSSIPYSTPLSVDMTISSNTTHYRWEIKNRVRHEVLEQTTDYAIIGEHFSNKWEPITSFEEGVRSVRPDHLAGGRQDGLRSLDGCDHL